MNNLGRFNPTQYSSNNPFNLDTGLSWQYIRIINNSPYLLLVTFGNQGTIDLPEMWLEDVPITPSFNGKITIAPSVNIAAANVNGALSSLVSIVCYLPGELIMPRAQPLGTPAGIGKGGQTFDALLTAFPSVNITINTPQVFALGAGFLNIAGVSAQNPGFLILGYFNCDMGRQTFKDTRGNREISTSGLLYTVPGNANQQQQVFTLAPANYLKAVSFAFFGVTGVTINFIEVKRTQDAVGAYVLILPRNITNDQLFDVGAYFGSDEGMTNLLNQAPGTGFNVRVTASNTNAGAQSFNMYMTGKQIAYDEAVVIVVYQDWQGNNYTLGTGKVGQLVNWLLNFLVPIPITDPTQTNFGSISFTVISDIEFYNTNYTFDVTIPCFVTQLAE